jgi:hypothetical protein
MDDAMDPPPGQPMDEPTDQDPVLRSLGEDLARDDPRLAALLSDGGVPSRRWGARRLVVLLLLAPALATVALLLPPTVALGILAILLGIGSPLVVCWFCMDDRPAPRLR